MSWPLATICFLVGFAIMHIALKDIFVTKPRESKKLLRDIKRKEAKYGLIETFRRFDVEFNDSLLVDMRLMDMMEEHFNRFGK